VVRGARVPTEAVRNASWPVSRNRHASQSFQSERPAGTRSIMEVAMPRRMTNWVNYDPWVMGALEPILLLLCVALIGAVLGLL
jgi:hypothetical protein